MMAKLAALMLFMLVLKNKKLVSSDECETFLVSESLSLQQAIDGLSSTVRSAENCSIVEIPSGQHIISSQTIFSTSLGRLEFRGLSVDETSVVCDYEVVKNYTWYFEEIASLTIRNINFSYCPRPIQTDTVGEVGLISCSFSYFSEAVLDVFNCHHTTINGIKVEHNSGSGISNISYRGNTGGIAFGYNRLPPIFKTPSLTINDSEFRNNSARADSAFLTSSNAFSKSIFTGRGGALGVFVNESQRSVSVSISGCVFEGNYACSFGGGIYLLPGGNRTSHYINVQNSQFRSNVAGISGGGVQVTYPTVGPRDSPHVAKFVNCNLTNNSAHFNGGGMYISSITHGRGNSADIQHCEFTANSAEYGGALVLKSFAFFLNKSSIANHTVSDCNFTRNHGYYSGVLSVWFVSAAFSGTNILSENTGNALQVIASVIHFSGNLYFLNNDGGDDSALHLRSFSQAVLATDLMMTFENNSGRFGAGIYVDNQYESALVNSIPSACFLRHEKYKAPEEWENITVTFTGNQAILASNLYMSLLDQETCSSTFHYTIKFLGNRSDIIDWPIWELGSSNMNTGYSNSSLPKWSIQTSVERINTLNTTVKAWPGMRYTIVISGLDVYNTPTTTVARLNFSEYRPDIKVTFNPEVIIVAPDPHTRLLTQQFIITHEIKGRLQNITGPLGDVFIQPIDTVTRGNDSTNFTLEGLPCPAGYTLSTDTEYNSTVCKCNDGIVPEILLCKDNQEAVIIEQRKWAVYVPTTIGTNNMRFYPCPPDYCSCSLESDISDEFCVNSYVYSNPDLQCICGRKGILCGECSREGDGVSVLLNECVSCPSISALLIPALVFADLAVLLIITIINISLPSWMIPFIFYIQIAPIVGLHFPPSFILVEKYLYFIASASGFYFVYDFCLYEGLNSEVAYSLRYLPLLLSLLICITVFILRTTRRISRHKVVSSHGVWSVVLLMYTSVVHTALSILNCHSISDSQGDSSYHWFVNGSIKCFAGTHILLALISLTLLLGAAGLIAFCVFISICNSTKLPKWLRVFQDSLILHYRQSYRWWSAIDLTRRFIILLFITLFPSNTVVPILLLAIYTTVYTFVQPYKSKLTNKLESVVNVNFLFLFVLNATTFFHEDYLTFPDHTQAHNETINCSQSVRGVATLSWILMPVYYLPLLFFCLVLIYKLSFCMRQIRCVKSTKDIKSEEEFSILGEDVEGSSKGSVAYTNWDIDLSSDGFLYLQSNPSNSD